jgi:hypothetical protein
MDPKQGGKFITDLAGSACGFYLAIGVATEKNMLWNKVVNHLIFYFLILILNFSQNFFQNILLIRFRIREAN